MGRHQGSKNAGYGWEAKLSHDPEGRTMILRFRSVAEMVEGLSALGHQIHPQKARRMGVKGQKRNLIEGLDIRKLTPKVEEGNQLMMAT